MTRTSTSCLSAARRRDPSGRRTRRWSATRCWPSAPACTGDVPRRVRPARRRDEASPYDIYKEIRVATLGLTNGLAVESGGGVATADPRARKQPQPRLHCAGEVRLLVLDDDASICRL